ncbi:MAG: phosphatase PAP2 family protein [Steroidobacteraceae bacterium]
MPLVTAALLAGCGTLPGGRAWGEDATLAPGWQRVREAAWSAARNPRVWVPLAGAALLQVSDWDRDIADWARRETPLFGSNERAGEWSDDLRTASVVAFHVTALATPGGDTARDWFGNKLRGYAVDAAAIGTTTALTQGLKSAAGRVRPNGADDESFPSGHTAVAAVHGRLAQLNLRSVDIPPPARRALGVGLDALTVGTSWARIEAGWHFPSDTLVSASLGAFFAQFYDDAFLRAGETLTPTAGLQLQRGGAILMVQWRF